MNQFSNLSITWEYFNLFQSYQDENFKYVNKWNIKRSQCAIRDCKWDILFKHKVPHWDELSLHWGSNNVGGHCDGNTSYSCLPCTGDLSRAYELFSLSFVLVAMGSACALPEPYQWYASLKLDNFIKLY